MYIEKQKKYYLKESFDFYNCASKELLNLKKAI